jgi:hypothetical protein
VDEETNKEEEMRGCPLLHDSATKHCIGQQTTIKI